MTVAESRIREHYPMILMTILSLIVALVYENLIGSLKEQDDLFRLAPESVFVWAQCFFMLTGPLSFWFAHSLFSCSVRPFFARGDAIVPILAAIAFNVQASNLGPEHASLWLLATGGLGVLGGFAMLQFGRRYGDDPELGPSERAHRASGRMMFGIGVTGLALAGLFHIEVVGYVTASVGLVILSITGAFGVFVVWFGEWQEAVDLIRRGGALSASPSPSAPSSDE